MSFHVSKIYRSNRKSLHIDRSMVRRRIYGVASDSGAPYFPAKHRESLNRYSALDRSKTHWNRHHKHECNSLCFAVTLPMAEVNSESLKFHSLLFTILIFSYRSKSILTYSNRADPKRDQRVRNVEVWHSIHNDDSRHHAHRGPEKGQQQHPRQI